MNARARHFYILAISALFLVLAPVVVLAAFGYRFDRVRGRLQKTGAIVLATLPRGATITVDGSPIKQRTPTVVRNVLPGDHVIRLTRPDAALWEKRVTVIPGRSTLYDAILLGPTEERWREERVLSGATVLVSHDGNAISWRSPQKRVLVGSPTTDKEDAVVFEPCGEPVAWSPFNRFLLCRSDLAFAVADRQNGWTTWPIPMPPGTYTMRWNLTQESYLYAFSNTTVYEVDLYARAVKRLPVTVSDLLARDQTLFTIEQSGLETTQRSVVERAASTYERIRTWRLPPNSLAFAHASPTPLAVTSDHEMSVVHGSETVTESFAEAILGSVWSASLSAFLVWTEHEVWVLPTNDRSKLLVGRFRTPITRAWWAGSWPAVLIQHGSQLLLHDIDPRGQPYGPALRHAEKPFPAVFLRGDRLFVVRDEGETATVESVQLF